MKLRIVSCYSRPTRLAEDFMAPQDDTLRLLAVMQGCAAAMRARDYYKNKTHKEFADDFLRRFAYRIVDQVEMPRAIEIQFTTEIAGDPDV